MHNRDRTVCRWGHTLTEENVMRRRKLASNGRWYVVRECRTCRRIAASVRWYYGKTVQEKGYRYRGAPLDLETIVRRVERRARRLHE